MNTAVLLCSIAQKRGIWTHLLGKTLRSERKGYDSIFVTSNGRVTSYGPQGELNWQVDQNFILKLQGISFDILYKVSEIMSFGM